MAFNTQSPGVQIVEKDASATTPGASSSIGGFAGTFVWGPVAQPILVSSEQELVSIFGKPDDSTFSSFFAAANFLSYSNALWVNRAETGNKNATSDGTGLLVKNSEHYSETFSNGSAAVGMFAAKYPGTLGNGLKVSFADSSSFDAWDAKYKAEFSAAPGTSDFAKAASGGADVLDELHIVIVDSLGKFTGTAGAILEKFAFVSKAKNALSYQGTSNYYGNVLAKSGYVWLMDQPSIPNPDPAHTGTFILSNWGADVSATVFHLVTGLSTASTSTLTGGADDNAATAGELETAFTKFVDAETYDISLLFTGKVSSAVAKSVVDNVAEVRKDLVVFASAVDSNGDIIFGTSTTAVTDAGAFKTAMGNSSYAFYDSGYKYQYDKYNDKFRWVALNADMAGLCARVDQNSDAWFSPGGLTKGQVKNVIKLAWNPTKAQRDELYKNSINPVVTLQGQGTVLYGDKTGTSKPSAFDRINVRRLFIVIEKSIARSARFQLFEQNDAITRSQFVSSVEPFLRDVQGRRGIDAFRVICDETNNTPTVVANNEFRGTILIKPVYSINVITLTFTAVGPAVDFAIAAGV